MASCVVKWCRRYSAHTKASGISFHVFPQDPIRRELWTKAVQLERHEIDWMPGKRSKICSIHFKDEDFHLSKKGFTQLNKTAVPICTVLNILYVGFMIYYYAFKSWRPLEAKAIVILAFIGICLLLDMAFNIIFILAGHKKNVKLLKISYIYNIVWLALLTLGNCFQLYMNLRVSYRMWSYKEYRKYVIFDLLISSGFAFALIFVQIYLILLIRSEMVKLKHQTLGMQFTNHAASGEPQCTLHNASDQHTDGEDIMQNCCTDKKQGVEDCCTDKNQGVQNCCTKEKCNQLKGSVA